MSWGAGEVEFRDGLYLGFKRTARTAVIGVENTPGPANHNDALDEAVDAVDGRIVSSISVCKFTMDGFLYRGDHSQSDVALILNVYRDIKCPEGSGIRDDLHVMNTASLWF